MYRKIALQRIIFVHTRYVQPMRLRSLRMQIGKAPVPAEDVHTRYVQPRLAHILQKGIRADRNIKRGTYQVCASLPLPGVL